MINTSIIQIAVVIVSISITAMATEMKNVMGYKDQPTPPFIGTINDNSGLYNDLFKAAAKKVGASLEIVRFPKKRVHLHLKSGSLDFYPGASFSQSRAEYLYYLPMGFGTKEVVITSKHHADIADMSHVSGKLLVELGSSKLNYHKKYPNLDIVQMSNLPIKNVLSALAIGRGDFFISDVEPIIAYMKHHNINREADIGIKIHYNAINQSLIPMYLGFSRKSPLFQEVSNPKYDPDNQLSISNFPTLIVKESVAYQFYSALQKMKERGELEALYSDHFER